MDDVTFGYVYDFGTGEEWTAERGGGAMLNGAPLAASRRRTRSRSSRSRRPAPISSRSTRRRSSGSSTACGSSARSRSRSATSPTAASTRVCSLKGARSVDIAAAQLLVRERGYAIELFEDPPFGAAPLDLEGRSRVVAAGTPELCETTGGGTVRIGCSGWNYTHWRTSSIRAGCPARRWLEHYATLFDTVEVNTTFYRLPKRLRGGGLGRAEPARVRLRGEGEPLPDAPEAAHGQEAWRRAVLRADRAARPLAEARARSLAAAAELPPQRRAARRRAGGRCRRAATPSSSATRAGSCRRSTSCCASTRPRS